MDILITKVVPDDYKLLSGLGAETFYETWRPVNTEEDMQEYMANAFQPEKVRKEIEDITVNTFLFAFAETKLAGYAKMRRDRTYDEFKNSSAIEVERIYVKNEFQKLKIGKALMDECIELAKKEKREWIWLGVNIDNHKAIDFYKKYDFTIFGEKMFQLGAAMDKDYLMKKRIA